MAIDISKEELLTLTEVTKVLPKVKPRGISSNCVWRWCRQGIKGVTLDYVRIGARMYTSTEALNRFANAVADADRQQHAEAERAREAEAARQADDFRPTRRLRRRRTALDDQRLREIEAAEAELDRQRM